MAMYVLMTHDVTQIQFQFCMRISEHTGGRVGCCWQGFLQLIVVQSATAVEFIEFGIRNPAAEVGTCIVTG